MVRDSSRVNPYFVGPFVDLAMLGGISIFLFFATLWIPDGRVAFVGTVAYWVQWVINWPHFSATNHRLYGTAANRRQYPVTALLIPWLAVGGIVASFADPQGVAPHFVKFFMLWSPFHFCAQTFGICLLYARRSGFAFSLWETRFLRWFLFGIFLAATARAETGPSEMKYFGIDYPVLGLPKAFATFLQVAMYGSLAAFLGLLFKRGQLRHLPPAVGVLAAAQFIWFMFGYRASLFYIFVPAFHSLQYLLVAWAVRRRENPEGKSWAWYGGNVLGGAVLFWVIPKALSWGGWDLQFATGVVIAGVQIHHFFVDGVIWKLRNPNLSRAMGVTPAWVPQGRAA